jgi:mannose-6-phosphate isomerase
MRFIEKNRRRFLGVDPGVGSPAGLLAPDLLLNFFPSSAEAYFVRGSASLYSTRVLSVKIPSTSPVRTTVNQPSPESGIRPPERVDKPWGHEEIFALVEGRYVGKLLFVNAGESLSLQYHHAKDETIALVSGRVEVDLGGSEETLRALTLSPGDSVHVLPGTLHRLRAVTDSVLVEASTADPGWREDIVRIEDHYGRLGTTAP